MRQRAIAPLIYIEMKYGFKTYTEWVYNAGRAREAAGRELTEDEMRWFLRGFIPATLKGEDSPIDTIEPAAERREMN